MQEASCSEQDFSVVLGCNLYNLPFCLCCFAGKRGQEGCERQPDEHTEEQGPLQKRWQQQTYEWKEMWLIIMTFVSVNCCLISLFLLGITLPLVPLSSCLLCICLFMRRNWSLQKLLSHLLCNSAKVYLPKGQCNKSSSSYVLKSLQSPVHGGIEWPQEHFRKDLHQNKSGSRQDSSF